MTVLVVFPYDVATKVPIEVAPGGMDVIGSILNIVVLNEEVGTLYPVIMSFTHLVTSRPSENNPVHPILFEFHSSLLGDFGWHIV